MDTQNCNDLKDPCIEDEQVPCKRIFEIPYFIYDKFIDELLVNVEYSYRFIPADLLEFFTIADSYAAQCTRYELGAWVMRKRLLELAITLQMNNENNDEYEKLRDLIDQCLSFLPCKMV